MSEPFVLDPTDISNFQACKRRYVLGRGWHPPRWRPKALFDSCLRQGIEAISGGVPAADAAKDARAKFLEMAASPGLDVTNDPYTVARDWCAMLDTVLRGIADDIPKGMLEPTPVTFNSQVSWQPRAWATEGMLHRWITVSSWSDDDRARELHSWWVVGDVVVRRTPMTLHVVVIGTERKGRRASAWARAWKHPGLPNMQIHFLRKDGKPFRGWKPVYLADLRADPDAWVEQMRNEGALALLRHKVSVRLPSDEARAEIKRQILVETEDMRMLADSTRPQAWTELPMSRNACDGLVPCPFQNACYHEGFVSLSSLGYVLRNHSAVTSRVSGGI